METETVDTKWPSESEDESRFEDSDITSRDLLENVERTPLMRRFTWPTARDPLLSLTIEKRRYLEEGPDYSSRGLEEALSMAQTFFRLGTLLEEHSNVGGVFVYNATGVINGYIPEPQISIPVKVARDVIEKSKANGCWGELNVVIELAKATYATLKKIELLLEKDPEIPDRETLRFILTVSGNPEQILEEESKFKKHIRSKIRQHTRENITITYCWK
jgi:hypothetical protein